MRTRVHNNAGTSSVIKESFQVNIGEDQAAKMTLLVKDQAMMVSTELARVVLTKKEVFAIEDSTGKQQERNFSYSEENFQQVKLGPRGTIWIAIAPVDEWEEEKKPLMRDDSMSVTC
jgi:hypothetical protein